MILDSARNLRIGDLVIVRAFGTERVPADRLIPVAYHLRVIIANAEDPLLRGKRFKVRPLKTSPQHHADRERQRSELIPLVAYGMKIVDVWRDASGHPHIKVGRDPDLVPETDEPWGNPYDTGPHSASYIYNQVSVDERAMRYVRLDEMTARGLAA